MLSKVLILFALSALARGNSAEDTDLLWNQLASLSDEDDRRSFDLDNSPSSDLDDSDDLSELRRLIADNGLDADELLSDMSLLSAVPGLFSSGDAKRFATLNFVYQLACYQGRTGWLWRKVLWVLKEYNGYACYCGSGYYYGNYLDATDYCCKIHDECYERAMKKYGLKNGCHTYTTPYSVSCCKDQKYTKCTDSGPSAGRALCECDQGMSRCVAQKNATSTYNKNFRNNRSQCKATSKFTKAMTFLEILKSCRHAFKPRVTFPKTIGSQGTCPAAKKKSGWWFGKKRDE